MRRLAARDFAGTGGADSQVPVCAVWSLQAIESVVDVRYFIRLSRGWQRHVVPLVDAKGDELAPHPKATS